MSNSRILLTMMVWACACGGGKDSGGSGGSAAGGSADAPKPPPRVSCVDLPGAPRSDLQLSKDGKTLYYVEETTKKLGDERVTSYHLYALDVATKTPKLLVSDVSPGVAIAPNGTVVFRRLMPKDAEKQRWDNRRHHQLMMMAPDKEPVAITDGKEDVGDIEIDPKSGTIAFLQGDFYPDKLLAVPLAGGTPQLLLEHTYNILGLDDGAVYVNSMRQLKKQPLPSGAPADLGMLIDPVVGLANGAIITKARFGGAKFQIAPVATPDKKTDLAVAGDKLGLATAGDKTYLFASKPDGYEVATLTGGKLAPVLVARGARPHAAAPVGDKLAVLAIVDSDGDGELGLDDEADVCFVAPGSEPVDMPTRTIPKRFVEVAARLAPLWKSGPLAGATVRFTTIGTLEYLQLSIAKADGDLRKLVASTQDEVTRKSGLAQLSLIISERDTGRRAVSRWDDRAKKFLATSGIGLAQVADRSQYQIEVDPHVTWHMAARSYGTGESTIGSATCSGTIKNISDKPLVDVEVECSNEMRYGGEQRQKAKVAPQIAPNASAPYKVELDVADSERGTPLVITAQGANLSYLNTYAYKRNDEIATAALKVAEETKLAYWSMDSVLEGQSYNQKRWLKIYVRSFLPEDKVQAAAEAALPKLAAMAAGDRNYEGTPMLLVIKGDTDAIGWSLKDGRFSEGEPKENAF